MQIQGIGRSWLLALLVGAWTGAASAASKPLLQDLVARSWAKEDDLPDNSVTAVLHSRDGYLWAGNEGGLGPVRWGTRRQLKRTTGGELALRFL